MLILLRKIDGPQLVRRGAIVLRTITIFVGGMLLAKFHWMLCVFGGFLLLTGIRMLGAAGKAPDFESSTALKWMRKHLPLTPDYHGSRFVVTVEDVRRYTPLFVVIVLTAVSASRRRWSMSTRSRCCGRWRWWR